MISEYRLRKLALTNSRVSRKELTAAIRVEAKEALKRIYDIHSYQSKAGKMRGHSFALDKLEGALNSLELSTGNLGSLKSRQNSSLARQLSALQEFNRSVTSTVAGIKRQEKLLRRNIRGAGIKVARGSNWDRMVEIFTSEAFKEWETFGSPRRFAIAYEAAKRNVTDADLEKIQELYEEGMGIDEAWVKVAKFSPLLL